MTLCLITIRIHFCIYFNRLNSVQQYWLLFCVMCYNYLQIA
jgi:hypothetical protein